MRKNRNLLLVMLLLATLVLPGCWDRVELEERGFVMAMAIDLKSPVNEKETQRPKLSVTYQVAIPAQLQAGGGGKGASGGGSAGGGQPGEKAYTNLSVDGDMLFKTVRLAATRSSRSLYFEHNKLVLIGEDLAKSPYFMDVMDLLLRDREMRRRMKVITVKGKAKDALDISSPQEKLTSQYLDSLSENSKKMARMPEDMSIGDLSEKLVSNMSFLTQRLIPHENEGQMIGAAVFDGHDRKLAGWLNGEETEGVLWLSGKLKGGITVTDLPSGDPIAYEIRSVKARVEPKIQQGKYNFTIHIESEGSLGESWAHRDALDKKFVKEVETATNKEVQRLAKVAIAKLQKELGADVIGLGNALSRKEPKVWETVKDDWDHGKNYFATAKIDVDVKTTIRFQGVITHIK